MAHDRKVNELRPNMPEGNARVEPPSRPGRRYELTLLFTIAALVSWVFGAFMVALPFVVKRFGGSDMDVGFAQGISFLCYLFGCIVSTFVLDRFNGKYCVLSGIGGISLVMVAICLTVSLARPGPDSEAAVRGLFFLSALVGAFSAAIWPSLMGWVSAHHKGEEFNRRLGAFSVSWSLGSLVGMVLGGILVQISPHWPFFMAGVCAVMAMVSASVVHYEGQSRESESQVERHEAPARDLLARFFWVSRLMQFMLFICIGIVTSQLGLLFKFELGFAESQYGFFLAAIMVAQMGAFYVGGKVHDWYFRMRYLWACHGIVMVGLLIILQGGPLATYFATAILLGLAKSLLNLSHLYYSAARSMRRSVSMAVHEAIVAVALFIGAVAGGWISDHYDRYMPYKIAIGIVGLSLVIQTMVRYYPESAIKLKRA